MVSNPIIFREAVLEYTKNPDKTFEKHKKNRLGMLATRKSGSPKGEGEMRCPLCDKNKDLHECKIFNKTSSKQSVKCAIRGTQIHCMVTNQKKASKNETIRT